MAKAETKGAAKEQQNVSADNVVEKLMKGNLVTDIADKAAEEIRQDEEKRKIYQVKEIVKCADYLRIKELLNVRKDRAKAKITLDILKKRTDLLARLLGKDENGTVVPDDQKITPNQFRDLSQKIDEDQRKQMNDLNNEYEKHDRELRTKYPNNWYYANYQFDRFQFFFQYKYLRITYIDSQVPRGFVERR